MKNWRPQGDSNPRYRRERAMSWASRRWGRRRIDGGARRDRTADLLHAMQALSQLSYGPTRGAASYRAGPAKSRRYVTPNVLSGRHLGGQCGPQPADTRARPAAPPSGRLAAKRARPRSRRAAAGPPCPGPAASPSPELRRLPCTAGAVHSASASNLATSSANSARASGVRCFSRRLRVDGHLVAEKEPAVLRHLLERLRAFALREHDALEQRVVLG